MAKEKTENNEEALRELLMATSHEKLVDILLSLHENNKQLDIIFAGLDDDPKKIVSMIKKEIASLKRSRKFFDYYESNFLANSLDDLRLVIVNDLGAKSAKIAFEMMLDFVELHKNSLERADDSNGAVSGVFISACEDLGSLGKNINNVDTQEMVEIVFSLFMNNDYGVYDDIILHFKDILKDKGLDLLQDRLEQTANEKNTSKIKIGLKSIADCKNDVDLFIRACSFKDGIYAYNHIEIAKRLITHWRAKEALHWLDTMDLPHTHSWQHDRKNLRIQALELDGDYEQAQNERLAWFAENLSSKLYGDIMKAASQDFKETFKFDAINKAFQYPEAHIGLDFLLQIQEFGEIARFVRSRFNDLNGRLYGTLRTAADLLQNTDPIASTVLYRKMIEPILEDAKSKYYGYAAKDMVKCSVLANKITDWENLQWHEEYFKEIEIKHKRKRSFWSEYESALQKQTVKEKKMANHSAQN